MWIVYTFNCKTNHVDFCCYTHNVEKGLDALDDYSICAFRKKVPDYPSDKSPLDTNSTLSEEKDGYYLLLDPKFINGGGDSERVNLFKVKGGKANCLRFFQVAYIDKYVDDFLCERTQAVVTLEKDAQVIDKPIEQDSDNSSNDINLGDSDEDSS